MKKNRRVWMYVRPDTVTCTVNIIGVYFISYTRSLMFKRISIEYIIQKQDIPRILSWLWEGGGEELGEGLGTKRVWGEFDQSHFSRRKPVYGENIKGLWRFCARWSAIYISRCSGLRNRQYFSRLSAIDKEMTVRAVI